MTIAAKARHLRGRLWQALPVCLLATFLVFGLLKVVPGDPAVTLAGESATVERIQEIRAQYGLDRPFLVQYGKWLGAAATGDLGQSMISGEAVATTVLHRISYTLLIVVEAMVLCILVGVPLGIAGAIRPHGLAGAIINALSAFGVALPTFWIGMVLASVFALELGWFPASGSPHAKDDLRGAIYHSFLPAVALGAGGIAEVGRQLRSALLEILSSPFVRTLRAKGLSESSVIWRHGLRNAGVVMVTLLGLLFGRLLGATVVLEAVFAIPGIGSLVVQSALDKDFPVVQGVVFVLVLIVLATNLVIDVVYTMIDPRIN